ncbi:tannase and feruloyl esterase [Penicillium tannophilum]|nr:tannase and feruloyl esterase [Penicillium tannophilum]
MRHCYDTSTTTNASWNIAGLTQASTLTLSLYNVPSYSDVKHDILLVLVNLVENGTVPEYIFVSHIDTETLAIYMQRPSVLTRCKRGIRVGLAANEQ